MPSDAHILFQRLLIGVAALGLGGVQSRGDEREDLAPQPGQWQIYPSSVAQVAIDRAGRAWFMLDVMAYAPQVKNEVEQACHLKAPWAHARIELFDSHGRVWLRTVDSVLLAYDMSTGEWLERHADTSGPGWPQGWYSQMLGPVVEDAHGRVLAADSRGVHVLEGGKWSYQPLYSLNFAKKQFVDSRAFFATPQFAEDPAGRRMYVWTRWTGSAGTLGFWVFQDGTWRQSDTDVGSMPGRLKAVVPLANDRVLLIPEKGPVEVRRIYADGVADAAAIDADIRLLDAADYRARRDAQRRLLDMGPAELPRLMDALRGTLGPEARSRLESVVRVLQGPLREPRLDGYVLTDCSPFGRDGEANQIVFATSAATEDGPAIANRAWLITPRGRVLPAPAELTEWTPSDLFADSHGRLFAAVHRNGMGVSQKGLPGRIVDFQDAFERFFGEDRGGRIYARTRTLTVAMRPDAPDVRRGLAVTRFDLARTSPAICQDSEGHTVAALGADGQPISRFERGRWTDLPDPKDMAVPNELTCIQPLRAGGFIVADVAGNCSFFDGDHWSRYRTFRALVEQNYRALLTRIDNRSVGFGCRQYVRSDARGNIWCCDWDHVGIYDGTRWIEWRPPAGRGNDATRHILCCFPFTAGRRMILGGTMVSMTARAEPGRVQSDDPPELPAAFGTNDDWSTLHVDSRGSAMVADINGNTTRLAGAENEVLAKVGVPRLEDSAGRVWFVKVRERKLVLVTPDGHRQEFADDAIFEHSTFVEEQPGSYWMSTNRGLLHLVAAEGKTPAIRREGGYYEKNVPSVTYTGMWLDPERNLWISNGGDRLYRVELPP